MSTLLELLGKGLEKPFLELVLPMSRPLSREEEGVLAEAMAGDARHRGNRLRLAIHLVQTGVPDKAEALLEEVLAEDEGDIEARLTWAALHLAEGRLIEAAGQLEEAQRRAPRDSRVLFGLGLCREQAGDPAPARRYYEEAAAGRPYLRQPRERLAAICVKNEDYAGAIELYTALKEEHPEDVGVYLILGQLHLQLGQYQQAIAAFERALTIEPDNFELHDDYVQSLAQAGQLREAIEQMHHILEEQGEFADTFLRLGDLYSQAGNDEAAVRYYERALEHHPGYLEAAVKLGTQHLRRGRYCPAAASFNRAIEINDQLITAYVGLGIAQQYEGQGAAAADTLELAGALEPNTNLLFAEMARLQLKAALAQQCRRELGAAKEGEADDEREVNDLLDLQIERHRQTVLERPNHADLHYRYGLLLRGRGRHGEAVEQFQQALRINPAYVKARIKLGLTLREQGRTEDGIAELRQALECKPEYVDLHYRLGLMYCDKMQFALAVEHFETALKSNPENVEIHANLALALQNMGLIDRATASWRAVCELDPQSTLAYRAQRELIALRPVH